MVHKYVSKTAITHMQMHHSYATKLQRWELHMVRKRGEGEMAENWSRTSNLQIFSRPLGMWTTCTGHYQQPLIHSSLCVCVHAWVRVCVCVCVCVWRGVQWVMFILATNKGLTTINCKCCWHLYDIVMFMGQYVTWLMVPVYIVTNN